MTIFEILDAISRTKDLRWDEAKREYSAYSVNRFLSSFPDTVLYANEMNTRPWVDEEAQASYYVGVVRSKKRFFKWPRRASSDADVQAIQAAYGLSEAKAAETASVLTREQLDQIKDSVSEGGRS